MFRKKTTFLFLILIQKIVFARAGGSGSSGSSSHSQGHIGGEGVYTNDNNTDFYYFVLIGICAFLFITTLAMFNMYFKSKTTNKLLQLAAEQDTLWNLDFIKQHTFDVFCKVQKAWEEKNLNSIQQNLSHKCYKELSEELKEFKKRQLKNILENIEIQQIQITITKDYKENSKDSYIALIYGLMVDYSIDIYTKEIMINKEKNSDYFQDTYEFIRIGDKWVLNSIENQISLINKYNQNSYKEE